MSTNAKLTALARNGSMRFVVEAIVVVALLFVTSRLMPTMPVWALALVWAFFSFASMIGVAYHDVISKTYRQNRFTKGGKLGRFNAGRVLCLVVAFVVSAACMASLLISSVRWGVAMWVVIVLAIPVYLGVSMLINRFLNAELQPLYRQSFSAIWSSIAVGAILCIAYAVAMCMQPVEGYSCAAEAFLAVPPVFENSPSAVLSEAGTVESLVEGLSEYALSKAAEGSYEGYVVARMLLNGGAFFAVAVLLSVCSIDPHELARVFTELESPDAPGSKRRVLKRHVALAALLPVVLITSFAALEADFQSLAQSEPYTRAKQFVKEQVNFTVFEFDGKYYDPEKVEGLLESAAKDSTALAQEAKDRISSLVNASFDARIANVDSYLDWNYRLFGDWEQLFELAKGNVDEFMQEQFTSHIEQGIDDSGLSNELESYLEKTNALQERLRAELSKYEIAGDYPEWIVTKTNLADELGKKLSVALDPSNEALKARERLGISVGVGIAAGFIGRALVKKIASKAIFKAAVGRVGGLAAATTASSAAGPLGLVLGVTGSLAVDIGLQKLDEVMNREAYRQEIVDAIEEERTEVLNAIDAQFE